MAQVSKSFIDVTPQACIGAAVMLLVIPVRWVLAWMIAATCHELFHCLGLFLCGKAINGITIDLHGAQIQTGILSPLETFVCSLAGPVGGSLLLLLSDVYPRLAVCALVQSAFNLLPVYPLDGGRALMGLTDRLFSGSLAKIVRITVETIVLGGILVIGFISTLIWKLGILPALFAALFVINTKKIKIPCK